MGKRQTLSACGGPLFGAPLERRALEASSNLPSRSRIRQLKESL